MPRRRFAMALVVTIALPLAVAGLTADAVGAAQSPYTAKDTRGEVPAKADLRKFKVVYDGETIELGARLRKGTDPRVHRLWVDRLTGVMWLLDVPGGGNAPEYAAFFYNGGPGVLDGEVDEFDFPTFGTKVTETDETFHGGNGYRVEFPAAAIGSPAYLRVQAIMVLDKSPANRTRGIPSDEDVIDYAPNVPFELSPKIRPVT